MKSSQHKMAFVEYLYGPVYWRTKDFIERTSRWTRNDLDRVTAGLLSRLLEHAVRNIPFYRDNPDYARALADSHVHEGWRDLPMLDKDVIRQNIHRLKGRPSWLGLKKTTGGSTGEPLVFFLDRFRTRQKEKAFIFDQWRRAGYRPGDALFNIRGAIPRKGKRLSHYALFNTYVASSLDLSLNSVTNYVDSLNRIQPAFLHGYPSTVYLLATLIEEKNCSLDLQLSGVLCGSEKLLPYQRHKIERVFGCGAFNWYGHSEYQVLASECEHSPVLHVYPQYGYLELLPTGHIHENGREIYEMVATGFNNYFMPLIRYRTGDYAVIADNQTCACGRNYLLLDEVIGREQEFIVDRKGDLISVTASVFGQHYESFEGIREFQIIQEEIGKIRIKIQPMKDHDERVSKQLIDRMQHLLGNRVIIEHEMVHFIDKTAMGKRQTVIQHLNLSDYLAI
jgi:phenylacetate-CoA ligase